MKPVSPQYIPFTPDSDAQLRQASVGGKTFYYEEDRDIDVNSLLTKDLEKVPVEVALRSESCFLAVERKELRSTSEFSVLFNLI